MCGRVCLVCVWRRGGVCLSAWVAASACYIWRRGGGGWGGCEFGAKMLTRHAREAHLRIHFLIMRIKLRDEILAICLCHMLITVISIDSIHGMFPLDDCD